MNIYSVIVTGFSDDKWLIFDPQNNEHGTPAELSEEQIEQCNKMKKDVLEKYHIKILGKKLKPYFEENYLVFDYDENK